ncbi:T9SS type A sorting domain-containing protein [bacterium]|nr:T9SS type A sorting domain-containing protein [bacterium]
MSYWIRISVAVVAMLITLPAMSQEHWGLIYSEPDHEFFDVAFTSETDGWITTVFQPYSLYHTANGGYDWEGVMTPSQAPFGDICFLDSLKGIAAACRKVGITTNGGRDWELLYLNDDLRIDEIVYEDSLSLWGIGAEWQNEFILRWILHSEDGGYNWHVQYVDTNYAMIPFQEIGISGNRSIIVGTVPGELLRSANGGTNWIVSYHSDVITQVPGIQSSRNAVFFLAGSLDTSFVNNGYPVIIRSLDDGQNWETIWSAPELINHTFWRIFFADSLHGWAGGNHGLMVETSDGGSSWHSYFLENASGTGVSGLFFLNSSLGWATDPGAGRDGKVYRYLNGGFVAPTQTGTQPETIQLYPNYPNPFNSSTRIIFDLPKTGLVKLNVCDVLGRRVATLVNGVQEAGYHSVLFDGSNLPSGIYFCRLEMGDLHEVKKMVMLK